MEYVPKGHIIYKGDPISVEKAVSIMVDDMIASMGSVSIDSSADKKIPAETNEEMGKLPQYPLNKDN